MKTRDKRKATITPTPGKKKKQSTLSSFFGVETNSVVNLCSRLPENINLGN